MAHEAGDDLSAAMSGDDTLSSSRQKLLWSTAVVLANVDYFEELSARLVARRALNVGAGKSEGR